MTKEQKLQYAIDNYSFGDKISRNNFAVNSSTIIINKHFQNHHFCGDNIYLGNTQIYDSSNNYWALNLTRKTNKYQIPNFNYEIY